MEIYRTQVLAFLFVIMSLYIVIVRKPIAITVFDLMILLIVLLDHKALYFRSKIPVDKGLALYLCSTLVFVIFHRDFGALGAIDQFRYFAGKEIIQIIELSLFYVIIVSYFSDFTFSNADKQMRFLKASIYIMCLALVICIFVEELTGFNRNLLNFIVIPILILAFLTFFYQQKIGIVFLNNRYYCFAVAGLGIAVLFYENTRTGLLYFVLFIGLLGLNLKKRYLIPLVSFAVITGVLFSYILTTSATENFRSQRYDAQGRISYVENVNASASRGLNSLGVLFENLPILIEFMTSEDDALMTDNVVGSNYDRIFQLKFVYQSFRKAPIFGSGSNYAAENANVHGSLFVALVDYGLVGLIIFLYYIFSAFIKSSRLKKSNKIFDLFSYYYLWFTIFVLFFVSAGLFPILPFVFISTIIHVRYIQSLHNKALK